MYAESALRQTDVFLEADAPLQDVNFCDRGSGKARHTGFSEV